MDLHISVIADFKSANPDIEVVDWCLSGHAWVMNRTQERPKHINPSTWQNLNMDMIRKFQDEYDSFLRSFDGFIVGYASSFAMIYEKYNKPILMLNAVRYDIPFCFSKDTIMLEKWHECLDRVTRNNQLIVVSNNKADQLYTEKGAGISCRYIPSLCLYTNTQYNPTKSTFLTYDESLPFHSLLTKKSELPHPHQWSDITSFRGIIHMPYEISLMSLFEQFSAGCPLFFPSKSYWKANPRIQSISAYWGDKLPSNLEMFKDLNLWIDLADMYDAFQSPNTYYYDSIPHLFELIETFQYIDDQEFRKVYIENTKQNWKLVLQDLIGGAFWKKKPAHICYNRLPLLANVVYDVNYAGSDVEAQHTYPFHTPLTKGDVVFIKTDFLGTLLDKIPIPESTTLITGVSDFTPSQNDTERILNNPNIIRWIGCNITASHPKIRKLPIGVGEPQRKNGNHDTLLRLHTNRIPWNEKKDEICIPYHNVTHTTRTIQSTLPNLEYEPYMQALSEHKFVVCQRGNGLDTHRVCEVLLMGSVPILLHSGLDDMYSQWPCILVDSFDSISTSDFVWDQEKYESFLDVFWLRDKLKYQLL